MLALEAVKKLVPKNYRSFITQEYLDTIAATATDSDIAEQYKENFITYLDVLSKGRYKMEDYVSAIKFVSHKLLGKTDVAAYAATFPERYQRLVDEKAQIAAFVSMYARGKLVMQIFEQTLVPTYVLNAPLHQEALNTLARMITSDDIKGMAKVKACEAILEYTKPPAVVKGELTISMEQSDSINDLRDITEKLANTHRTLLEGRGMTLKEIAEDRIVETSFTEVGDEND